MLKTYRLLFTLLCLAVASPSLASWPFGGGNNKPQTAQPFLTQIEFANQCDRDITVALLSETHMNICNSDLTPANFTDQCPAVSVVLKAHTDQFIQNVVVASNLGNAQLLLSVEDPSNIYSGTLMVVAPKRFNSSFFYPRAHDKIAVMGDMTTAPFIAGKNDDTKINGVTVASTFQVTFCN